jgi:hypothetical protein
MIPNFDDDRINFVRFIQENKEIFDELLESGRYNLTRNIYEGYYFFKNFDLFDDANVYALTDNLDDFNTKGKIKIQTIINEFERWLESNIQLTYDEKEYIENTKNFYENQHIHQISMLPRH